jgi:hypothetical protein
MTELQRQTNAVHGLLASFSCVQKALLNPCRDSFSVAFQSPNNNRAFQSFPLKIQARESEADKIDGLLIHITYRLLNQS